jgi:hypothetical protein
MDTTTAAIKAGDQVVVRTADGEKLPRRAVTGPYMSDFLIIRICSEGEWQSALAEDRDASSVAWPAEDVQPA